MKYCIGIDIGGTKCSVVSADVSRITLDPQKDFLTKRVFETDVFHPEIMIEKFCVCIDEIINAHTNRISGESTEECRKDELVGIGISCGGPLDSKLGIIQCPPNLPGWDDVHICDETAAKIDAYVAEGGRILATGSSGVKDGKFRYNQNTEMVRRSES